MKSNLILKIGAVLLVVIVAVVFVIGKKEVKQVQTTDSEVEAAMQGLEAIESGPAQEDNGLTHDFLTDEYLEEEYAVDTDSPIETMRTLTNETRAVREDSVKLQEENRELEQKISRLLKMEEAMNKRVDSQFNIAKRANDKNQEAVDRTQGKALGMLENLKNRMDKLQTDVKNGDNFGKRTASGFDVGGAGIPTGLGYDENGKSINYDEIVWAIPVDATVDERDSTKITVPDFGAQETIADLADRAKTDKKKKDDRLIKVYTIPSNATLLGSVSMTAILGRIPTNGQVQDPYPFKMIIGQENLSSNGIEIPGVTGIQMSGYAKGDWTLSCVSGEINSMTFTFTDGTILTVPEPGKKASEPLAWFSDRYGIPCVTGKRITNAVSYLAGRVGLTTASGYAQAQAASEITTEASNGSITSSVTGDAGKLAANMAVSEGLNEVTDWLDARQENSFDAIYVPPGTEVVIHVTQELKIDYDPQGRKVNHYANIERRTKHYLD